MAVGRRHGFNNQEGALVPQYSAWGQAYLSRLPEWIYNPTPIGSQDTTGFGGTVGGVATRSASVLPLVAEGGYWGDTPQTLQGMVNAADPWLRQ